MRGIKLHKLFISASLLFLSYFISLGVVQILNVKAFELIILIVIIITISIGAFLSVLKFTDDKKLKEALEEQIKIRSSILNLAQNMTMIHSITELHDMILQTAVDVLPNVSLGSIMILQKDNCLKFTSVVGFELEELEKITLPLKESYMYHEVNGIVNKTVIIENVQKVNASIKGEANEKMVHTTNTDLIKTTLTSPFYIDGKLYGMMNVDSQIEHAFTESDVELMSFFANEVVKVIKLYDTIEENNRLSKFDPLTNLYNRRYLHHRLKKLTVHSDLFTLVSMDINNLKHVNDRFGHDLGDELLLKFVSVLNKTLSSDDFFSRYGGDEFIIVYDNKSKAEIETLFKEEILPSFSKEVVHKDMKDIRVSFSYGMTNYPEDALDYEELMIKADQIMYSNKRMFHEGKVLK